MRHHETKRRLVQEVSGHASEDPFTEPTVAVSSRHDQIRTVVLRQANEVTRVGFGHVDTNIGVAFRAMTLQVLGNVANVPSRGILHIRRAHLDNHDLRGFLEEWQSSMNGDARFSDILPAHHDSIGLQFMRMLRHQNSRPSHLQDRFCRINQAMDVYPFLLAFDDDEISRSGLVR